MRTQFRANYARIVSEMGSTVRESESQYVNRFEANYVATYQIRSAIALGIIGGPSADDALRNALQDSLAFRSDVIGVIRKSLVESISVPVLAPAPVGATVAAQVRALGGDGDPVPGIRLTFTPDSGHGYVLPVDTVADVNGAVEVQWTLGPGPGVQRLNVAGANAASTISITATPTSSVAILLTFVGHPRVDGTVGEPVLDLPTVQVTDGSGNPLTGVTVFFSVSGSGAVSASSISDSRGLASVGLWNMGTVIGPDTLRAVASTGSNTVEFVARGRPRRPAQLTRMAGDGQSGPSGSPVSIPPSVRVMDAAGNPVEGIEVLFVVVAGGGSVTGALQTTNSNGRATVDSWTLGDQHEAGRNRLRVHVRGVRGVVFSARVP